MADPDCLPWWFTKFDDVPAFTVSKSGCFVGPDGNNVCAPEDLRADAEAQMNSAGYPGGLSLEAYTLARYMQSEVGVDRVAEAVAVTEAGINRAGGGNVNDVLLYRPGSGYGAYGPIHQMGTSSGSPYGRWAATSQDPSLKALLIAQFMQSGAFTGYSGADDQDGPEVWVSQGKSQDQFDGYVANLARNGKYWVGPLPGIDHWRTLLQYTPGISAGSAEGQALMQRGIDALQLPMQRPDWSGMSVCSQPVFSSLGFGGGGLTRSEVVVISVLSVLAVAGAIWFDRWLGSTKSV